MGIDWSSLVLLAQEGGEVAEAPPPTFFLLPIMATLAIFYFLIIVPERKRTKKKQDLIGTLKKNDKVVTIGGIFAVVANVKAGEDEVTLKIDEDKDVKIRVSKSSIAQVLTAKQEDKTE